MSWFSTTIRILKLVIVAVSVIVQIRIYPTCLIPLSPFVSLYCPFPHLEYLSLWPEGWMEFILGLSDYYAVLVFNKRESIRNLEVLDSFESYFIEIEVRKKFCILSHWIPYFTFPSFLESVFLKSNSKILEQNLGLLLFSKEKKKKLLWLFLRCFILKKFSLLEVLTAPLQVWDV